MALANVNPVEKKRKKSKLATFATALDIGGSAASLGKGLGGMFGGKDAVSIDDFIKRATGK